MITLDHLDRRTNASRRAFELIETLEREMYEAFSRGPDRLSPFFIPMMISDMGSGAVSISFAAVALARKIFGDLKGRNVLVIGAGEMGKLTALHMKSQGVHHMTIVSRTMAHAARRWETTIACSVSVN